jgi:hypothetical protein
VRVRFAVGVVVLSILSSCASSSAQNKGLSARQTLELIAAGLELTAASVNGTINMGRGVMGTVVGAQVCRTVETIYNSDGVSFAIPRDGCSFEDDEDGNLVLRIAGSGTTSQYFGLVSLDFQVAARARFVRALNGGVLYFVPTEVSIEKPVVSSRNLPTGILDQLGFIDGRIRSRLTEEIHKPRTYLVHEKCVVKGWVPSNERPAKCEKDGKEISLGGTFEPLSQAPLGWERVAGMKLGVARREIERDVELAVRGANRIRKVVSEQQQAAAVPQPERVVEVQAQPVPVVVAETANVDRRRSEMVTRESPPAPAEENPPTSSLPPQPPAPASSSRRVPLGAVPPRVVLSVNVQTEMNRGNEAREAKNYAEAAARYRSVVEQSPELAEAWFALGEVSKSSGELATAIHAYEKYTRLQAEDPAGYYGLARSYELAHETQGAIVSYERYLELEQRGSARKWVEKAKRALDELKSIAAEQ